MRVAVTHGYYLSDSGSGIYVRELTRALVRLGHDVTLVCQERHPEQYDFIDSVHVLDESNRASTCVREEPRYAGSCRLVRPDLGGRLLVYVRGPFPGFDEPQVTAFQDASAQQLDRYIEANVRALRWAFAEWAPELVLAQHLIMQPFIARQALAGSAPYVVTEHGSALNFSVRTAESLVPFALDGLTGAANVVAVSAGARADLVAWSAMHGVEIARKTRVLAPGIDTQVFAPSPSRTEALEAVREAVDLPAGFDLAPDDLVVAYAGALRATKGVQYAVAAIPPLAEQSPRRVRLLVAGDGPARGPLAQLSTLLDAGDVGAARELVARDPDVRAFPDWGPVVADAKAVAGGPTTALLGHLSHRQLATVFAAADIAVAPSTFPEAAALVTVEALSAGAIPLAANHSGMTSLVDYLVDHFSDPALGRLTVGCDLTRELASLIARTGERYPTADPRFRAMVHRVAVERYPDWVDVAARYLRLRTPTGVA